MDPEQFGVESLRRHGPWAIELAPRFRLVLVGADADPIAAGHIGLPITAGDHDLVRIGGDDLLGVERAEGAGNDLLGDIPPAGHFDELAEIIVAEGHAAIVRIAAGAVDEHGRAFGLGRCDDLGDATDLGGAPGRELLGPLLFAKQLAEQTHARLGMGEGMFPKVDIDHGNAGGGELLDPQHVPPQNWK